MTSINDKLYDEILFQIGNDRKFQKVFNYLFNFFFVIFATMASFNIVLAMAVPDHWCKAPHRDNLNYSVDQWKINHIPWTNTSVGPEFDKCRMYNENNNVTECLYGWDYDNMWYTETIPSKENWVCQNQMQVTNSFVISRVGEIVGTLIFGHLGDKYGRKSTFFISLVTLFIGRIASTFTTSSFILFLLVLLIGNLSSLAVFQSPLIIGIEISKDEDRTFISLLQCISWTIGLCALPFIFWFTGHWLPFMLISTIPLVPFMFLTKYMVESPRWLVSKGDINKCIKELRKIAKMNHSVLSDNCVSKLRKLQDNEVNKTSFFSLFSSWAMAKITFLSMTGWACYMLIYITLYLNITNLGGNPFLNFFWQGLAELPGYFLGKYLTDSIGRKYTRFGSFLVTAGGSVILIFFIKDSKYEFIVSIISVFLKFSSSVAFYAIFLHTLEIFPTSLRQTGTSVGTIVGYIFALGSPYIVYLGTTVDVSYPYVLTAALGLIGGIFSIFLPETLNQKLPETIEEVEEFVNKKTMWNFPKSYNKCSHTVISNDQINI